MVTMWETSSCENVCTVIQFSEAKTCLPHQNSPQVDVHVDDGSGWSKASKTQYRMSGGTGKGCLWMVANATYYTCME